MLLGLGEFVGARLNGWAFLLEMVESEDWAAWVLSASLTVCRMLQRQEPSGDGHRTAWTEVGVRAAE